MESRSPDTRRISVVYALPDEQKIVSLTVAAGTAVSEAVERSGLLQRFPEAALQPLSCAVFGRAVPLTYEVREGDRIEILRPLAIDPKQHRRQRAKENQSRR